MRVCLFEDSGVDLLEPLTLSRPVFNLLCGMTTLADKQRRHFDAGAAGALVRPLLADLCRLERPDWQVNDNSWLRTAPTVLVNGRWLPPAEGAEDLSGPFVGMVGDEVAFAVLEPEHLACCTPASLTDSLDTWKALLPHRSAGGLLIRYPWELVNHNAEQLRRDFRQHALWTPVAAGSVAPAVVGPVQRLWIDPTACIEPLTVVDTTGGPVVIAEWAKIAAFTRLEGPCYVGPHTQVFGAKVRAGTTLGPHCRIGGEVEASIVHGHCNKYHDGFLGHSYLGEWINLGAGTQNSDLRNDYGEVTVTVAGQRVATGLTKVGCFLGDHTKTGLGTLLNTGTNVGLFCNLLPGSLLPKHVPSFCSYWNGVLTSQVDVAQLLETAAHAMGRRGRTLTECHATLYRAVFEQTQVERRRVLREAEQRRLRRSA